MNFYEVKKIKTVEVVLIFGIAFLPTYCFGNSTQVEGLIELNESELNDVSGQALLNLSYISPNSQINKMQSESVAFYKFSIMANLSLNANIRKLQLGCGGDNGKGDCDIDIDNLSLSGVSKTDTRESRVGSSALLTNPFLEFAIRNPDNASTREVVGFRLSAEKVLGLLTVGTENSTKPNGINSLSGYMKIKNATGTGYTSARSMRYLDTGMPVNGKVLPTILGLPTVPIDFTSTNYSLQLQEAIAPIFIKGTTISGNRMKNVNLSGYADINQIKFSGDLTAKVLNAINLQKKVNGNITGLRANISIDENLGFIHKIALNNPFSLSLQNNTIWWPDADVAAQRGWWLAFDDEIDIGNISPSKKIDIANDVLKQVVNPISNFLKKKPIECSLLDCILGSDLNVGKVSLPNTSVNFPLKDLQLKNQSFIPNCYGALKFC